MTGDSKTPFAQAIDSFLSDIKREEDTKSPFYREVLTQASSLWMKDGSAEASNICAEELREYVKEIDAKGRKRSKTVRAMDAMRPFFASLSQFTTAFDVLVQAGPSPLVIIYGGARLLLQLSQAFNDCLGTVLDVMQDVAKLLKCYELFSSAYPNSRHLCEQLVESYKHIIKFWQESAKLMSKAGFKTLIGGLVKPLSAKWQEYRLMLQKDSDWVCKLAQGTEGVNQSVRDAKNSNAKQIEARQALVKWIAGDNFEHPRTELRSRLEEQHPHTCEWIYDNPAFKYWLDASTNQRLWFHAGPGTGKSILCASLVKHLQGLPFPIAFFFFSFSDPMKREPIHALRSLILQLITQTEGKLEKIMKIYENELENHVFRLRDEDTAWNILLLLLTQCPRVHLVLDGLDECQSRGKLLKVLETAMRSSTFGIVKWFISSTNEPEMRTLSRSVKAKEIAADPDTIMKDIRSFLHGHQDDSVMREGCIDHWTKQSNGNFLWMSLMLKTLQGDNQDIICDDDIDKVLNAFPKGLVGCYVRSLHQLSSRSEPQQRLARKIFCLLTHTRQPLRLSELSHALGTRKGIKRFSRGSIPKSIIIEEICGSLVTFDRTAKGSENDPLLKLSYHTVQEFFDQDPTTIDVPAKLHKFFVDKEEAHNEIGDMCLTYLCYERYQSPTLDVLEDGLDGDHAFLNYAATFWFWHVGFAGNSEQLLSRVANFIRSRAFWNCTAVQAKVTPHLFARYIERGAGKLSPAATGLRITEDDEDVHFAVPLPDWLDKMPEGQALIQSFMTFIKEWQPVLTMLPHAVPQCCPRVVGDTSFASSEVDGLRTIPLRVGCLSGQESVVDLEVDRSGSGIKLSILSASNDSRACLTRFCYSALRSENQELGFFSTEDAFAGVDEDFYASHVISRVAFKDEMPDSLWTFDSQTLDLTEHQKSGKSTYRSPNIISGHQIQNNMSSWQVYAESTSISLPESNKSFAYHCTLKSTKPKCPDSGYGSATPSRSGIGSDEDSAFDEDDDSDNDSESGDGSSSESLHSVSGDPKVDLHCMVIVSTGEQPFGILWKLGNRTQFKITPAFHPTEPLVVWSPTEHEISVLDIPQRQVHTTILPEPMDIQQTGAKVSCRELSFSSDGKILHYVLASLRPSRIETTCEIAISSFVCTYSSDASISLDRTGAVQRINYKSSGSFLKQCAPCIITSWRDDTLILALPPLGCSPKVVRVSLPTSASGETDYVKGGVGEIQVLKAPIYFPSSTPYRRPRLAVLGSETFDSGAGKQAEQEHLTLILDSDTSSSSSFSSSTNPPSNCSPLPPTLMTWPVTSRGGWRSWSAEEDGTSEDLKLLGKGHAYEVLRGSFVDREKRFSVPIRSGLDWRKKAYVSCA
ncbi:hypothetical protein K402DRAFT_401992 [Aulographum hederae CBS 113979]|uniref:Uncharacterized protein n=1 Tax=Aulographum hederae CBS 113979 TaxID=1176131 RepID=A0A6G1H8Q3_9PEZI|nr:hypothetical protein K402DRAFT_401992 [Aulographum hederae CBS 113979]